ncbi:MAG: hypothetical protein K2G85_05235 [Muribaculaceae bacterium]|nr:hypothetical protein [Muribaculaceae bacterium]
MKRFYYWIVTAIMVFGILPMSAQEDQKIQFTVNVPNPEAVSCTLNGEPYELVKGANKFDVAQYTNLYFTGVSPWRLTGITDKMGTAPSGFYGDSWYLTVFESMQDEVFTLSLINLDEFRTSTFTINVDDPSLVVAVLGGYYTTLDLQKGENIIKFDPAKENFLTINPSNNVPLYSVKINGTEVAANDNTYYVEITDDCVIDIVAILPDEEHIVNFSYSEEAEGSISILVNDNPVTDFNGKSVAVKLGDKLTINGNTSEYSFTEVKVNNETVSFNSSYSFAVMKDSEVFIDAHPYGNIKVTLIIPNPELISIYNGYAYGDPLPMKQGENEIELSEINSIISWTIDNMAILNSVMLNGEAIPSYYSSYTLHDGDVLTFDITEKVFDKKAIVWIDNTKGKACSSYMELSSTTDHTSRPTFENGYNILSFYEQMNPFSLSWYGYSEENPNISQTGKAYLNGTLLKPMYEGSTSYYVELADNDVLKLFMDSDPVECKVAFDIAEGIETEVIKDIVTVVENPTEGFDCFAGTQVKISGNNIKVSVNGEALTGEPGEDGISIYSFAVEASDTAVAVTGASSSVSTVDEENNDDVYNMQGMKVGKASQMNDFTPGIYIVNGKKKVIR